MVAPNVNALPGTKRTLSKGTKLVGNARLVNKNSVLKRLLNK